VRDLVVTPDAAFAAIKAEPQGTEDLYLRWILPWSAFFIAAGQIGAMAFPTAVRGVSTAPSTPQALWTIVIGVAAMAGGVYALAWITEVLARRFGGRGDANAALKLIAFSGTALWVSGVFGLAPILWPLSLVGLYCIYLLRRGLPILLDVPPARANALTAAIVSAAALLAFVGVILSGCVQFARAAEAKPLTPPPVVALNPTAPIADATLVAFLPEALPGGWLRVGVDLNFGGSHGFTGRTAIGTYERGAQLLELSVIDLGLNGRERAALARALHPLREGGDGHVRIEPWNEDAMEIVDVARAVAARVHVFADRMAVVIDTRGGVDPTEVRALVSALPRARLERLGARV
jgi:hypothetical protein